eukprot:843296_1
MASRDKGKNVKLAMDLYTQISDTQILEVELQEALLQPSASYVSQNDEDQHLVPNLTTSHMAIEVDEQARNIEMQPVRDESPPETSAQSSQRNLTNAFKSRLSRSKPYQSVNHDDVDLEEEDVHREPKKTSRFKSKRSQMKPIANTSQHNIPIDKSEASHATILSNELRIDEIAEILRRNEVLISDKELSNILKAHQKKTLIDDLCDGYQTTNDRANNMSLCKALEDCNMLWPDRQIFYDIVLKEYVQRRELNNENFVKILKKTIIYLQLDCDLEECARLARNANLKGKLFYKELEDDNGEVTENKEYKSPKEFADVFKEMEDVRPEIWMRVYRRINEWKTKNYQKIDYNAIERILTMYEFI